MNKLIFTSDEIEAIRQPISMFLSFLITKYGEEGYEQKSCMVALSILNKESKGEA